MRQAKTDLAEQIFSATDRLMAREAVESTFYAQTCERSKCGRRNDLPLF